MTTETEIQEICRRLGWEYHPNYYDDCTGAVVPCVEEETPYINPETNAALHVRWLDMLPDNISIQKKDGMYRILPFVATPFGWGTDYLASFFEAIRAALLAQLRSEQDG